MQKSSSQEQERDEEAGKANFFLYTERDADGMGYICEATQVSCSG